MYAISSCLCGINCKYSGGNNYNEKVKKIMEEGNAVLVCPEVLGGLPTPRVPAEIVGGTGLDVLEGRAKVINRDGKDVTHSFIKGAMEALRIIKEHGCDTVILKSKSPSCGFGKIYDGSFKDILVEGNGVTAELLIQNNIKVITEKEL